MPMCVCLGSVELAGGIALIPAMVGPSDLLKLLWL